MAKKKKTETDIQPEDQGLMEAHPKETEGEDVDLPKFNDDVRTAIAAKRRAQVEAEMSLEPTPEPIVEDPAEPLLAPEAAPVEPPPAKDSAIEAPESKAGSPETPIEKHKIIVDGQPIEYTLDELKAQAQLGVAGRKRMEEAAAIKRQAEEMLYASRQIPPQADTTTQQSSDIPDAELKDIAKRINYGSEEEQAKALKDAIQLGAKMGRSGPTPEQIAQAVTQQVSANLSLQQEQTILAQEFPDILGDYHLSLAADSIANEFARKYQALGQTKTRVEIFREAGLQTRAKYMRQEPSTPPPAKVVSMNDKIERKRAAPQPPAAANKVASQEPAPKQATPSQVVAWMQQKRGQPTF